MEPLEALEQKIDPWGEWRNPHEHPGVLEALVLGNWPYERSVGYIRALRPREDPHEATRWWESTESRAHLLNAILRRGSRPLIWVEQDLDLARWKLHYYLDQFGLVIRIKPRRMAHVILPEGDTAEGRIIQIFSEAPVEALLETEGAWWRGRWSRSSWAFRATEPVPPPEARWRRLVSRRPLLRFVDAETLLHYAGPEGVRKILRGQDGGQDE